ncbi:mex-3 RNA binding family member D [Chelydra serpentina]|uniref:Mex-3 RNA binding family member D n=1 Tax=Chelydra serpentina TaxID=8475 RepID=A0A8T1T0Y6_CHESE|nr:mex-3 RNA binding family member D [Chelydra serpentina]
MAKREILSAAEHFSMIRATRNKVNGLTGTVQGPPNLPGQTTIQVRVPYRVVGLVVGPKGATIKRIQQQTHTYIVTPSRDKEPVFEVTGMPENVDRAREEIEAHITMRTGSFIDVNADNDFHSNGTDVCLDLLGSTASLWAKAPNPTRRPSAGLRNDSLSSLGSTSTESYYSGRVADASPTSPYSTSSGFNFSEPQAPPLSAEDSDFGFDFLALDLTTPTTIWSPFERSNPLQAFSSCSSVNGSQRRNSSISGTATPRHSPTLPESSVALDHPLARRIQSDPVSTLSWLPTQGSLSSFSNSTATPPPPPCRAASPAPPAPPRIPAALMGTGRAPGSAWCVSKARSSPPWYPAATTFSAWSVPSASAAKLSRSALPATLRPLKPSTSSPSCPSGVRPDGPPPPTPPLSLQHSFLRTFNCLNQPFYLRDRIGTAGGEGGRRCFLLGRKLERKITGGEEGTRKMTGKRGVKLQKGEKKNQMFTE